VLAGIRPGDLAEDGSWPVAIARLGAAWPDPALPSLADGMTASDGPRTSERLPGRRARHHTPAGIVVIAAVSRHRHVGGSMMGNG
jgi:hypothetical protein